MEKIIHDEKNGLDYELIGDYYIPCLKVPEPPKVGRFGVINNIRKYNASVQEINSMSETAAFKNGFTLAVKVLTEIIG